MTAVGKGAGDRGASGKNRDRLAAKRDIDAVIRDAVGTKGHLSERESEARRAARADRDMAATDRSAAAEDRRAAGEGSGSGAKERRMSDDGTPLHTPYPRGEILSGISTTLVRMLKDFYGKGPERARTTYDGDLVVVVLRGGFNRVEQTLLDAGRGRSVIEQRMAFQEVMRERFNTVIERYTGRKVIAFMSGSHQDPDLLAETFILEPLNGDDLLADVQAGDGHPAP